MKRQTISNRVVLGTQRVRGAKPSTLQHCQKMPLESLRSPQAHEPAESPLAVRRGGVDQHPGGRRTIAMGLLRVHPLAQCRNPVTTLEGQLTYERVGERVNEDVTNPGEVLVWLRDAPRLPPAPMGLAQGVFAPGHNAGAPPRDCLLAKPDEEPFAAHLARRSKPWRLPRERRTLYRRHLLEPAVVPRPVDPGEPDERAHLPQALDQDNLLDEVSEAPRRGGFEKTSHSGALRSPAAASETGRIALRCTMASMSSGSE